MAFSHRWHITDASTGATSAALGIFSTAGFAAGFTGRKAIVHGYSWGTATTMASTDVFRITADSVTIFQDPVGARFSGGAVGSIKIGLGISASSQLDAGFSTAAADGGIQSFIVWGTYE